VELSVQDEHSRSLEELKAQKDAQLASLREEHGAEVEDRLTQRLLSLAGYGSNEKEGE
jgi:hypothetical protein